MGLLNLIPPDNKLGQLLMGIQQPLNDLGVGLTRGKTWQKGLREASQYTEDQAPLRAKLAQQQLEAETAANTRNRTAEWLRSQPGGEQFAAALENGMIDGSTAFKSWMDASKGTDKPPQNPFMSAGDGKFFNWQTGEYVTDPNAAPDPKELAADAKALAAQGRRDTATQTITDAAATARKLAGSGDNTGIAGAAWAMNPETDAAELRRQVEVLKSNASIENLTAMRQASPTGGALGSVTERENAMLAAAAGAIDPNAKKEDFVRALDNYELTLLQIIHGPQAGKQIFDQTRDGGEYVPQSGGGADSIAAADALLNSGKY